MRRTKMCIILMVNLILLSCHSVISNVNQNIITKECTYLLYRPNENILRALELNQKNDILQFNFSDFEYCFPENYTFLGNYCIEKDTIIVFSKPKLKFKNIITTSSQNQDVIKLKKCQHEKFYFKILNNELYASNELNLSLGYYENRSPEINFRPSQTLNLENIIQKSIQFIKYKQNYLDDFFYNKCGVSVSNNSIMISDPLMNNNYNYVWESSEYVIYFYLNNNDLNLALQKLNYDDVAIDLLNEAEKYNNQKISDALFFQINNDTFQLDQSNVSYLYFQELYNLNYWIPF